MTAKKNRPLQGLRALAILLVFMSHWYSGARSAGIYWERGDSLYLPVMDLGKYGVELFFMISGYVIVGSLRRHASLKTFFIDRFARIYPTFGALHLVIFIFGPIIGYKLFNHVDAVEWTRLFILNFLLLPGVFEVPIAQIVAWSLSYEVAFYLVAGWAFYLLSNQRKLNVMWLAWSALVAILLYQHPRCIFFIPGVLVVLFEAKSRAVVQKVPAFMVPFCLLLFILSWSMITSSDGRNLLALLSGQSAAWFYVSVALLAGSIAFAHIACLVSGTATFLGSNLMVWLGNLSYSFYLIHTLVIFVVRPLFVRIQNLLPEGGSGFLAVGLISLVLSIVISALSRRFLEVAAGERVKRLLMPVGPSQQV